jgi:CheY-like chemotaxis protein
MVPTVHVDGHELENALLNLAVNARDAMPEGGRLTISVKPATIGWAEAAGFEIEPGAMVEVAVTDTGMGMDEAVLKRAFDPFFTTKEQGKGTGLGLSMVYGFVKQSQGGIVIDSRPGAGTTVRLLFPVATGTDSAAGETGREPEPRRGSETILIVEDQHDVAELAADVLAEAGYEVLRASSGEEALQRLDAHPGIAMVFSDVVMPGNVSGIMLAREMRRRFPKVRVLLTTGYSAEAIEQAGEFDYLGKPYRLGELLDRIGAALEA